MDGLGLMWSVNPVDLAAVDPVHGPWTYSTRLFCRKIIQIIPKITDAWNFIKIPMNFSEIIF
jgi:hypothetical protein